MRVFTTLLALAVGFGGMAAAQTVSPENDVPSWAVDSTMQLSLSSDNGEILPLDYTIIPSTQNAGLNGSYVVRGAIKIEGIMTAATQANFAKIGGTDLIAYMSCDESEDSDAASPDIMLTRLMENEPKAIILFSTVGNWCVLSSSSELPYPTIFTMADAGDAAQALEVINGTNDLGVIRVAITGNATTEGRNGSSEGGPSHSAVAMTILYSITGLITLLFLVIIGTGAVRAHRHPERYGPRASYGGRPRQSRARGLARAVLETLPIVKFGDPDPPKPDPNYELEGGQVERSDRPVEPLDTVAGLRRSQDGAGDAQAVPTKTAAVAAAAAVPAPNSRAGAASSASSAADAPLTEEHLGCTICTEDFNVGEDVRVLPCNHKFHPSCIDPWLVNVSGTCPLCRLDLRPRREDGSIDESVGDSLPPPLDPEEVDGGPQRRRTSPRREVNSLRTLRHASAEEAILALRQYRTEQRARGVPADIAEAETSENETDARRRRTRLADRLREKFRVRTNPQAGES